VPRNAARFQFSRDKSGNLIAPAGLSGLWFLVSGFWFLVSGSTVEAVLDVPIHEPETRNQKLETLTLNPEP
jgi:hypothetical protein